MVYDRLQCPKCNTDFGQEVRFIDHLADTHGINDHLQLYLDTHHAGRHPTCGCSSACVELLTWSGWKKGFINKYVRGHNARVDSVYFNNEKQAVFAKKRAENHAAGLTKAWNVGLTKETDARIAQSSQKISTTLIAGYASGSIVNWRIMDPVKARIVAEKQSTTKKNLFESGALVPWNKGQTKETNDVIARAAQKISKRYSLPGAGNRIKPDELVARINRYADRFVLTSNVDEYVSRRINRMRFTCTSCGATQEKSLAMLEESPVCFECKPKESVGQLELLEFVRLLSPDVVSSDRTIIAPMELDVYVPSRGLGIEYDGLYWHSELRVDRQHATRKAAACVATSTKFFRVFEDEWRDKRPIVESMIRHRMGIFESHVGARTCVIEELDPGVRRAFISNNHVDGDVASTVSWGLVSQGKIIAALSLRRPFHASHSGVFEVARYCVAASTSIPGALSRLSKVALRWSKDHGARGLMTYVDRRIGEGHGYVAAGFNKVRETSPRFWWTNFHDRFDRFSIKADSTRNVTQEDAAAAAGVVRIWGCPNVVLELN